MSSGGATLQVAARSRASVGALTSWQGLLPLLLPCGLLVGGGFVGYAFTLNAAVAAERLLGLLVASGLAILAAVCLRKLEQPAPLLLGSGVVALLGGVWIIAAAGADVFRGPVGQVLQVVFGPLFGMARVTDPVEVANTRYIVGYNGLADLCLVAIFCCGALLLEAPRPRYVRLPLAVFGISLVVLIGTGARGGLTGLAAGVCAVGLYAWPRRYALLALVAAPLALVVAAMGILDKGLEFSSTAGRLTYWCDLARLLTEYPLTGVGLGLDTAFRTTLQYEINPDPERVFYAHNTFVQSYLEQGPLGALGMLGVPLLALAAALAARRHAAVVPTRRTALIAGLGIVGALSVHGLTDQVVTTNIGTTMLLLALAGVIGSLADGTVASLTVWARTAFLALMALGALVLVAALATPVGRAQLFLDFGGLKLNQALALEQQASARAAAIADAESILTLGLEQDASHPALLRELGRARAARFDDAAALDSLRRAAGSSRLDAFDMLQIGHLYRDLGFADEAYAWASRAYAAWGRPPEDAVIQVYAQSTLAVLDDFRARTLADQAEAAMRARSFSEARSLFQQALSFQPDSAYLRDRLGAAQRAVDKYGG